MTYLIVVFRADNSSKDVAGHFLFECAFDGAKIAIRIVDPGHNVAHDVYYGVIPLAVEFETGHARVLRDLAGALQILGDGDLAWLLGVGVAVGEVDLAQELRPFVICCAS